VTPTLSAVYEELVERAARPPFAPVAEARRAAFFARTGALPDDHPQFAARLAAAWEDALVHATTAGSGVVSGPLTTATPLIATVGQTLEDEAERDIAALLAAGQRGLFEIRATGEHRFLFDHLRGGSFLLLRNDELGRSAPRKPKDPAPGLIVGRVVGAYDGCTLLPGLIFLPPDATPHVPAVLAEARARGLSADTILDALLRMDHALHTLSRVKAGFAFRSASLPTIGGAAAEPLGR
jgi:hypothetical protein